MQRREMVALSAVSTVFTDGDWIESKDQSSKGIRLIQTGNIGIGEFKDRAEKARYISVETFKRLRCEEIFEGDCLISRLPDPVGRSCIIPSLTDRSITAVDCTIVRFDQKRMVPEYFKYFSQSAAYLAEVESACTGATRKRISRSKLGDIKIPLPKTSEQKRVVAILDEVFEGINVAIINARQNLTNAGELFNNTIVNNLFGDPSVRGWTVSSVEELAFTEKGSIRTGPFGSQLLHSEFVDDGVPVLGIDNAVNNEFRWAKRRFITTEKYKELARYTVKPGDVLITIMGTCGRCAVVPNDIPLAINTKHLCCITLDRERCLPEFLHAYFLYHPVARSFLAARAKGSIMEGLNMGIIRELPVWLPDLPAQADIISKLNEISKNTQSLQVAYGRKIELFAELKQAILRKAFAGELDISPEKALQEAAAA